VPLLGRVTCHRAVARDLAAAMADLQRRKLGQLVDAAASRRDGGCYRPRLLHAPNGKLTRHAWGIAVTVALAVDPAQRRPVVDQRLVRTMAGHGFTVGAGLGGTGTADFQWVGAGA
jgi:hypothetical protein